MIKTITKLFISFLLFAVCAFGQSTLENVLSPSKLPYLKASKMIQVASFDSTGGNNDRINIHPGKTAEIFNASGPGVITRIWITIDSRDPHFLRRILFRMYWDDETTPSVEVPVGDFFGTGFEYTHHFSEYVGMTSGGYFCHFPMPFQKNARIEVVNETGEEIYAFYYHINYHKLEQPLEDDVAYFHCKWTRDTRTSDKDKNFMILDAEGSGHFVGLNMSMQPYKRSLFYLEGDEMVYVDGEKFPSVYGTGTEDYFTSGWYFKNGTFAAPYHGVIVLDKSNGRVAAYRHHIYDAIPFKKSLQFTMEHGHGNLETCDFSATAYWYQKEPHKKFDEILPASMRIPLRTVVPNGLVEAEKCDVKFTDVLYVDESTTKYGPEWSNNKHRVFKIKNKDERFSLEINNAVERAYDVDVYFTTGPEYGAVNVLFEGKKVGEFDCYSKVTVPSKKVRLKNIPTNDDKIELVFESAGMNTKSNGLIVGVDGFYLTPVRDYVSDWWLIGPFPNPRENDILRYGLDTVYPPEKEINLKQTYKGAENQQVSWKEIKTPESGFVSLWKHFNPYEFVISYALNYVYSPEDQEVKLFIGSDDGAKVFLNDEQVYRFLDVRISAPDQDVVTLKLKKGWNKLLLKIENNFGGYGFYCRILDAKNNLIINKNKIK